MSRRALEFGFGLAVGGQELFGGGRKGLCLFVVVGGEVRSVVVDVVVVVVGMGVLGGVAWVAVR